MLTNIPLVSNISAEGEPEDILYTACNDIDHNCVDFDRIHTDAIYCHAVLTRALSLVNILQAERARYLTTPRQPGQPPRVVMAITGGDREGGNSSWLDDDF